MSSSPQSAPPTNKRRSRKPIRFTVLPCPMCGRRTLANVVEDCVLSAGRLVKRLPHVRCSSCGERFFDVAAMAMIEATAHRPARKRLA